MMTEEQRAAAMAMLGNGGAQQAAQAVNPMNRQAQLQAVEQAAMGGQQPPQQMAPQQGQGQPVPPQLLQRLLMMLRGGSQ